MTAYPILRRSAYVATLLAAVAMAFGGAWFWYDWNLVEKMLTRLAMPCGLIGCGLAVNAMWATGGSSRGRAWLAWGLLLFYWAASTTLVGDRVAGRLESRYRPVDPGQVEPFDTVIVLGGATMSDPDQNVWLGAAGDRVMLAARLFHAGRVGQLVTTGDLQVWSRGRLVSMADATERIWIELGIPAERITKVGGINTSRELRAIRDLLADRGAGRIGLLTSAFHLPRTERLAREVGVDVVPIPAGFLGPLDEPFPYALIPNAYGLWMTELCAKEFLAAIVRR